MTSPPPFTRSATFRARAGKRKLLASRLLHAASIVADVPGCELWLVHSDFDDPQSVRVTEMWASREQCNAALALPGVAENVGELTELVDGTPTVLDGEPLGGARILHGQTGATGSPFSTRPTSRRTPNCSAVTSSIKSARRATSVSSSVRYRRG